MAGRRSFITRWFPAIVFVLAVVVLMPKALAGQATFLAVDMNETTSPYREALDREPDVASIVQTDQVEGLPLTMTFVDALVDGDLHLWDPRVAGGTPTITAFPFLAAPLNFLYAALPDDYATTLKGALTLLLGQVLMFLLLRRLGVGRGAATFGAVAYAFSGTEMVFLQRNFGAIWVLPGLLWAVHRAVPEPSISRVLVVGLFVAWTWFEGFPAAFAACVYTAALWAVWLAYRQLRRADPAVDWRRRTWDAAVPALKVGAGFVWGVALAAVTLLPFLAEITSRGILDLRVTNMDSHLPGFWIWSLWDTSINGDPLDVTDWWNGGNPFETVTVIGSVLLAAAFAGIVAGVLGRLRLPAAGRDAWPFFAFVAPAMTFLIFVGTHVLGALYHVPGIGDNPIQRTRFLIALGICVLAALHLDAVLRRRAEGTERVPRSAAFLVGGLWLVIVAITADDVVNTFTDTGRGNELAESISVGVIFAAAAAALVLLSRRVRWLSADVVAVLLAAVVFVQVAWPLRNFTPQAPLEDFYPHTEGEAKLEELTDGRYRFAATGFNYYPNAAQLSDLYDLRGIALYDDEFRNLLAAASPETFARDSLKQVMPPEEWQLASPIYDDVALGYFALATNEEPYGERVIADEDWVRWRQVPQSLRFEVPDGRELAGVAVPLASRGDCGSGAVRFSLYEGTRRLDTAERPAYDAAGGWIPAALVGRGAGSDDLRVVVDARVEPGCEIRVGETGDGRIARWLYLDAPDDGVRLAATEQSWIYERPTALPLVRAHSSWRWFPDQPTALAELGERTRAERDVAYLVGDGTDQAGTGRATIDDVNLGDEAVEASVSAAGPSLVVAAQDYSEGWSVTVDGEPADMESIDGALMGVIVEAGEHRVRFEYTPPRLLAGAGLTLAAAILGIALVWMSRRRRAEAGASG
ncbi:MAG TPA: YfhO family protein [Solirubrobacterales bacterium]|nr:YfhO family protein [Solirubrobacterales bacterium]